MSLIAKKNSPKNLKSKIMILVITIFAVILFLLCFWAHILYVTLLALFFIGILSFQWGVKGSLVSIAYVITLYVFYVLFSPYEYNLFYMAINIFVISIFSIGLAVAIENNRKFQAQLLESERRLSLAQEFARIGVWEFDTSTETLYWSPECERLFGLEPGEFEGTFEGLINRVYPDDREYVIYMNQFSWEQLDSIPLEYEHRIIRKDGAIRWVRESAGVYVNRDNLTFTGIGFVMDITEQKQKEEEIRASEEKFKTYTENSPVGIVIGNENGQIVDTNYTMCEMTGYTREEILAMEVTDCLIEEEIDYGLEVFYRVKIEGAAQGEFWFRNKDNSLACHYIKAIKISSTRYMAIHLDITARKRAEEEKLKVLQRHKGLLANSPNFIAIYDSSGRYIEVSDSYANLFGCFPEEIQGKTFYEMVPSEVADQFMKTVNEMRKTGESQFVKETISINEKERVFETYAFPIKQEQEGVDIFGSITKDVTEREKAQEELGKSKKELELAYRQLNEEINKAVFIHERIMPAKIPQALDVSIAAHYQPAERMGGDYYNVIREGDKLILYLSDVMGHGLEGALISVFVKEAIDNYAQLSSVEISPKQILKHLASHYLWENYPDEQIVCIFIGVLDLNTYEFSYSSAGFQNFPLLSWKNGKMESLETRGLFINNSIPLELMSFEERKVYLASGCTLFISTDGLTEQNNGEDWFYNICDEVFYRYSHLPADAVVQGINKEFCLFNNRSLVGDDDITYLVLKIDEDNQEKHQFEITSKLEELKPLYDQVLEIIPSHFEKDKIIACVHELVANAVEHGNRYDIQKKVRVELTLDPEYVLLEIEDEGDGFEWCRVIGQPLEKNDFSERGRGVKLVNLMADGLFYNSRGNRATLLVYRRANNKA